MERTSEQRLARDRRLAMELLVEQTYRFPDKPPKNVAGLIDRASLLAFYRVHNAGLATEAKVEEILSGYRGRTHVLALMLAKKYGKKLVERLQSTPRSPASTARRGRALRPVNSSARQQRTKKKVRAAVVAEERVPFATSPDEERAAVASARLEARYAAERLHRERTRRAEEAVEVERARAEKHAAQAACLGPAQLEETLHGARTHHGDSNGRLGKSGRGGDGALTQPTLRLPRPAPRLHASRRSWPSRFKQSLHVTKLLFWRARRRPRMRRRPRRRRTTASSRRWRGRA